MTSTRPPHRSPAQRISDQPTPKSFQSFQKFAPTLNLLKKLVLFFFVFLLRTIQKTKQKKTTKEKKPFFIYVPFLAPHTPLEAPNNLIEKYNHYNLSRKLNKQLWQL